MSAKHHRSLALCVAAALAVNVSAQLKPFTQEQNAYLQEVSEMLEGADKKAGREFVETVFTPAWNGSYFSETHRFLIYAVSNYMVKKRFRPYPEFHAFFNTMATFASTGRPQKEFDAWINSLEAIAKKDRKKDLGAFLKTTEALLIERIMYSSASVTWKCTQRDFNFVFDSVPKIIFNNTTLQCYAKGDSAVIRKTKGVLYPARDIWEGQGGSLTWERAGKAAASTFAEWDSNYRIKLKSSTFEVDTVTFHDPYFDKGMTGKLTEKLLANVKPEKASYPQFESFDTRIQIRDLVEGVDFEGGFAMHGSSLKGYGTELQPAFLTFYHDQKPFIVASSQFFSIQDRRIASESVRTVIYLDNDSIYHPSANLKFMSEQKLLTLIKTDEGFSKSPFYDTYHKLDMYFEVLQWTLGDPLVKFGSLQGSTQTRASFESFNYFKDQRYMGMLGVDAVHPLVRLRDYSKQVGDIFSSQEYAVFARLQKTQVVSMLIDMANKGYLEYDIRSETVTLQPRLTEHILASAGKLDYDVLQFNSNAPDGVNATLDLANNDLALVGVSRIILSDSQDVRIFPKDQKVIVKKNRDFEFGGLIKAGKLKFYGEEYYFNYDPFVIDLLAVDSVSFYADSFESDSEGRTSLVPVKNVLEDVAGTLEIDQEGNKSGLKQEDFTEYPKFNSAQESFVFYDDHKIQKGVYDRERFYYRSEPFTLDSLDDFSNARIDIPGTLVSANIFADIKENLRLQEDYSLGFVRGTGDGGTGLYGKTSSFTNTITLNYKGLQGDGDIDFLTTKATSSNFVFCPDSTFGVADTLINVGTASVSSVPQVNAGNVFTKLDPGRNVLRAEVQKQPMVMYNGDAFLYGSTELTPKGMTGNGLVDFTNATLFSHAFDFKNMKINADTSNFRLTDGDTASIAFKTDNVNASIDLQERIGEFVSNGDETVVEFPVNQYICFMDRFKWYMDEGDIELESDREAASAAQDLQLAGSNFISIRPDQDSLSFMAPKARYDLKAHEITATNVEYIQVADALIYPDKGTVVVHKRAQLDPFENSAIVANYVTKYHNIYNATVQVKAKRNYEASGDYDYFDEAKRVQTIHLDEIVVDTSYQTVASGSIKEADAFQLSPHFDYQGRVSLLASEKELKFRGSTRILHDCPGLERNWMSFNANIDPDEVFIPVADTLKDDRAQNIGAGVRLTEEDPFKIYGTFLSRLKDDRDRPVITSSGFLTFNKAKQEYQISNKEKIRQPELPGDLVTLNITNCEVRGDGHISTGLDLGQVKLENVGSLLHKPDSNSTTMEMVMLIDFFFHEQSLKRMAENLLEFPSLPPMELQKTNYEKAMREVLGLERSDKVISDLAIKGEIKKLPEELARSIVLGNVAMEWNKAEDAFISKGPIDVATILKYPVFRKMKGKVELIRKRSGDEMTILLMPTEQHMYYFQYARNYLYVYSTDEEFNNAINELKEDKMKFDHKKGQAPYQFMLTNKRKANEFRDRYF